MCPETSEILGNPEIDFFFHASLTFLQVFQKSAMSARYDAMQTTLDRKPFANVVFFDQTLDPFLPQDYVLEYYNFGVNANHVGVCMRFQPNPTEATYIVARIELAFVGLSFSNPNLVIMKRSSCDKQVDHGGWTACVLQVDSSEWSPGDRQVERSQISFPLSQLANFLFDYSISFDTHQPTLKTCAYWEKGLMVALYGDTEIETNGEAMARFAGEAVLPYALLVVVIALLIKALRRRT